MTNRHLTGSLVVVGRRDERRAHFLRDLLSRNRLPYEWIDVATAEGAVLAAGVEATGLPLVVLPDGRRLHDPAPLAVADALGVKTRPDGRLYDLAIVGVGPSGLAAAVYAASEGLRTVGIEREATGGQAGTSSRIENYLGFPQGISGALLADRALLQAGRLGADLVIPQAVEALERVGDEHRLRLGDGSMARARAVLVATGVTYRRLDAPGVERLIGAGVYYGSALSEAAGCEGKDVYLVGAGNSAGQAALHLARFARRVTVLVRGGDLSASMSHYLVERMRATAAIEIRTGTTLAEAHGDDRLDAVTLRNRDGATEQLPAHAVFVLIGGAPHTSWLPPTVARDAAGYVLTGSDVVATGMWPRGRPPLPFETSVPGVFAVGDVRSGSVKRVASAVGEGSVAVSHVHTYLRDEATTAVAR